MLVSDYPNKFDTCISASSLISLCDGGGTISSGASEYNNSMHHFPNNTISSFIMELSHSIVLHGQWEVTISEIQFLYTFFYTYVITKMIRFVDIKSDEGMNSAFMTKEVAFPNLTNDIHKFIDQYRV